MASIPVIVGVLTLLGWGLDIELLTHPLPNSAPMNPTSAACFIAYGIVLMLMSFQWSSQVNLYLIFGLILIPVIVGIIRVSEWFFNLSFQIDSYLYSAKLIQNPDYEIVRMAGNSGFNFVERANCRFGT